MIRFMVFVAALWVVGCSCPGGDNLYYCLASPSNFTIDGGDSRDASDAVVADLSDRPLVDNDRPTDVADATAVADAGDIPDTFVPVDVVDGALPEEDIIDAGDAPDVGTDVADATDVLDVPLDDVSDVVLVDRIDAGTPDAPDVVVMIDVPDVPDVPVIVDRGPPPVDMPTDTGTDVPAVDIVDVPPAVDVVDVPPPVDMPPVVDTPDVPDVPPPPDMTISYVSSDGPFIIPSSGGVAPIRYSFGVGESRIDCVVERVSSNQSRCSVPVVTPMQRARSFLYMVVPFACGNNTDIPMCPTEWPQMWTITYLGRTYRSSDMVMTSSGLVPAIALQPREVCDAEMGYYNTCVRFAIPH
jgi:hypothetical protein